MFGVRWKSIRKTIERDFGSVPSIGTEELAAFLDGLAGAQPILLDVRTPEEYSVSHLPTAVRVSGLDQAREEIETRDYSGPVVAYCSVGYRSAKLVRELLDGGLSEVFNLDGSLFQWANEGRPLVSNGQPVSVAHPFDKKWGRLLKRRYHSFQSSGQKAD